MASDGKIIIDTSVDEKGLKTGLTNLGGVASTALKGVTVAIGAVSAALTAAGGFALKVGSDFEAGMSQVAAISGATGSDLDALTAKAKEMGETTKFSATQSAEAMQYMAMAGWKTEQMISGLPGIMNLAAASGEDLATTSDIVTDALTAFGLQAADSAHFSDVLAKASSSANTNVSLMGATFKYVAPLAGAMGYSIEDTAVAIGLMANAGIKGEMAGTALRAMLTRLVKPPTEAAKAMSALNVQVVNTDGSMKPLSEQMQILRDRFKDLTKAEKAQYASSIAGQEAMSGFLAIVEASEDDFAKLTREIDNADGAAKKMADTMNDNLQGQLTLLGSALEGVGIQVYEEFQEPLKEAVKSVITAVSSMAEAFRSSKMKNALSTIAKAVANFAEEAAKLASKVIPKLVDAFAWLAENGGQLIEVVGSLAAGFAAFKIITTVTSAIKGMDIALVALANAHKATTLAQLAANGALSMGQMAYAALTGQISLATLASTAWNAVLAINPIVLAGTAIAALAAGMLICTQNMSFASKETKELMQGLDELKERVEANKSALAASISAYDEKISAIDRTSRAADELAREIDSLSRIENKSEDDKIRLASRIEMLNKTVDGLNVAYDETNDILSVNGQIVGRHVSSVRAATKAIVEQMAAEQRYQASLDEAVKLRNAVEDAEKDHKQALLDLAEAQRVCDEATRESIGANKEYADSLAGVAYIIPEGIGEIIARREALEQANEAERAAAEQLTATEEALANQEAALEANIKAIEELEQKTTTELASAGDAFEMFGTATAGNIRQIIEALSENDDALDDNLEKLQEYTSITTNLWDRVGQSAVVTLDEMKANLDYNIQAHKEWLANLAALTERGLSEGLLAELKRAGVEAGESIALLLQASDEELQELDDIFKAGGQSAINSLVQGMGAAELAVPIDDVINSINMSIDNADLASSGKKIPEGMAKGMEDGQSLLVEAAEESVDTIDESISEAAEAHSPARRFIPHGENIVQGVAQGIEDTTDELETASRDAIEKSHAAAESQVLDCGFWSIGQSIAEGIADGIRDCANAIAEAARAAAMDAYDAARDALDINSPSKLFAEGVGAPMAEGIMVGFDDEYAAVGKMMQEAVLAHCASLGAHLTAGHFGNGQTVTNNNDNGLVVNVYPSSGDNPGDIGRKIGWAAQLEMRRRGLVPG